MVSKTILITQARKGSSRLPNKVLKPIDGKSLLQIHLERIKKCQNIDCIIVATTVKKEDKEIYDIALQLGVESYRGSELDVLDRFYKACDNKNPRWIIRVTADCPLIDPLLIDQITEKVQSEDVDYGSNILLETFPDGQDVEVFKYSALKRAWSDAIKTSDREHVTPYIRRNSDFMGGNMFKALNIKSEIDYSAIRMTVDQIEDFRLIESLIKYGGIENSWGEYVRIIGQHKLQNFNNFILRNEGYNDTD